MTTNQFIDDWIARNPKDCERLAKAAIVVYCIDRDLDTHREFISLEKCPDLHDVDREVINAIRDSSFPKEVERHQLLWDGLGEHS